MKYGTYVVAVCKLGFGHETCRYLSLGDGFECLKLNKEKVQTAQEKMDGKTEKRTAKEIIDEAVSEGRWNAQGDNCEGKNPIPLEAPEDKPF